MGKSTTPTVVLGFDGLDFRYLDEFREDLPNFSSLRTEGVEAPLRSTHPPWTGTAWPSLYTGLEPGQHGCYNFFDYGQSYPDEAEVVSRRTVDAPALWNYLTAQGAPSIVLNVPVTHPADPIEGVLVPGYLADEDAAGHPPGVRDDISDALGEPYRIYSRAELSGEKAEKLAGYVELVEMRGRAAAYLLDEYDWEVAVIQVQKTDAIFHNFEETEVFRRVYRAADEVVGRVLETVPDGTNVVVASDHGNGPIDGYEVFVNDILHDHGLLETTSEGSAATLGRTKQDLLDDGDGSGPKRRLAERLRPAVERFRIGLESAGLTVEDVNNAIKRLGIDELVKDLVPDELLSAVQRDVDWRASTAYCRLGNELGVRLNVVGREPSGVVAPDDYERVRTEIIDLFSDLRTPDGDPVFEFVARREEVYDGPHVETACDVVFQPTDMNHRVRHDLVGTASRPIESFYHEKNGVFVASGPAFESGGAVEEFPLTAVTPLVLASAGHPVPEQMAGNVPSGVLADSFDTSEYSNVEYGTNEGAASEPEVEQRLEDMGYL